MADHLINSESIHIAGVFPSITSLKALSTSGLPDQIWAYVEEAGAGEYYLDLASTEAESLPNILLPNSGYGRWIKKDATFLSNYNIIKAIAATEVAPGEFLYFNSGFGIDVNSGGGNVLNVGTGNANVINIGHSASTVNIIGTLAYNDVTNLAVADKLITINKGGAASSGMGSGFEIEEGGSITGSFKVDGTRNGFEFKAPAVGFKVGLDLSLLASDRILQIPNEAGVLATRLWVTGQGYLTSNQLITLTGHITGSGTSTIATTIPASTIDDGMINNVGWSKISSKPTTISGFGITDGVTLTDSQILTNKILSNPVISAIINSGTLILPTGNDTLVGKATTDTLTNKTLSSPTISTIINSGTLILPTGNDTLVGKATTDTLTNKTLGNPKISVGSDALGDLYYRDSSGSLARLPIGTSSQVLVGGTTPAYNSIASVLGYTPLNINGDTMTGLLVLSGDPVAGLGAATKTYVDNLFTGLSWKQSVVAGTTTNITLSGTQTIDGIIVAIGDRVLVKNQTSAVNNGIYIVSSGTWTRAADNDSGTKIANTTVLVEGGTVNVSTQWNCSESTISLGTTSITFVKISGAGTYTNGTGLSLAGNVFSIDAATVATLTGTQTLTNKTLSSPKVNSLFDTNGLEILRLNSASSSVNWIDLFNGATGAHVKIAANGSDTNVKLVLESKGSDSYVDVNNNTAIKVASGTTSQRPSTAINGMVRYNTTTNKMESYENGVWVNVIGSGGSSSAIIRAYQFSMLGEANNTLGMMAKASDAAAGTGNPSGAATTSAFNPGINNGYSDPYIIPRAATITSLRIKFAAAAVSTGTVGTPTVKIRIYRVDFSTRTPLSDVDITIPATGVGVSNNLSGLLAFQTAVSSTLSISVSAGDLLGIEFVNQSGTNNGINAISRLFAVMETSE